MKNCYLFKLTINIQSKQLIKFKNKHHDFYIPLFQLLIYIIYEDHY